MEFWLWRNPRVSLLPVRRSWIWPYQMKTPRKQGLDSKGVLQWGHGVLGRWASTISGSIHHLCSCPNLGKVQLKARCFTSTNCDTHIFLQTAILLCFQHVYKSSIAFLLLPSDVQTCFHWNQWEFKAQNLAYHLSWKKGRWQVKKLRSFFQTHLNKEYILPVNSISDSIYWLNLSSVSKNIPNWAVKIASTSKEPLNHLQSLVVYPVSYQT